ncbi:hypothetical protein EIN_487900 [Entamoeba invadens IP1]|uniref:Phosphoglycolate phosphatase n=1 Tax=Entamoeba invadens IP1 TaxID=370355 RepID=A0A0A1UAU7_ENTIV|nr:hypothetical protein EIN_487900 [Entamoeba invadens IP1]ELP89278.1 hypothetical protein EIN_487900 [Entamoeba invadens IP1]|eukprot:XP_004256049.1 hypothetical protein EIN_487900 [Entamoeba invadens IP1]
MPKSFVPLTLQKWYLMLWESDFGTYQHEVMGLSYEEMKHEIDMWVEYSKQHSPPFFEGIIDFLSSYKKLGGIIAVCSHSRAVVIEGHYQMVGMKPDIIYGSVHGHPELCKPNTFPIDDLKIKYNLVSSDILVIDDLSPGFVMAKKSGVDAVGVLYGNGHELIEHYIKENTLKTFETVKELEDFVIQQIEE